MSPAPDSSDLGRLIQRWVADHGEDRARRTASARLLGEAGVPDALTVVSVKGPAPGPGGAPVDTLWLSPTDAELAVLEPRQLVGLRRRPLGELLERGDVAPSAGELQLTALSPLGCEPPSTTLLHHAIAERFVDQTMPAEVSALAANEDAAELVAAELGPETLFLPAMGPNRVALLHRGWADHVSRHGRAPRAVVDSSGALYTFGDSPEACAASRAAVVERAARFLGALGAEAGGGEFRPSDRPEERMLLALAVRGGMHRASGRGWIARWSTDAAVVRLSESPQLGLLERAGRWPSDEHARLLGQLPLVFAGGANVDAGARAREIDDALRAYAHGGEGSSGGATAVATGAGAWPCVVLVPGLGALCLGRTLRECRRRVALLEHAARVVAVAARLGSYRPAGTEPRESEPGRARCAELAEPPLRGHVVLLTGADSGIGVATTRALLQAGAHVVITADDARVAETIGEAHRERFPDQLVVTPCDVTSDQECGQAVRLACDRFGGLDVLISNAGIAPSGTLHSDGGDAALRLSLDVNLLAHQRAARSAAQAMLAQGSGGVLLFNASKSAFVQGPSFGPYAVPKAALVALMRQYAIDLGPAGIRSNAVNADRVHIKRALAADPRLPEEERELMPSEYFRANLLRRETTPESVADAFVYLATAESTTGCVITVDGGNPGAFPR